MVPGSKADSNHDEGHTYVTRGLFYWRPSAKPLPDVEAGTRIQWHTSSLLPLKVYTIHHSRKLNSYLVLFASLTIGWAAGSKNFWILVRDQLSTNCIWLPLKTLIGKRLWRLRVGHRGFPGGSAAKKPPPNAEDIGLIPGLERSHYWACVSRVHVLQQEKSVQRK